ncbi:uncharacterized protein G2W53_020205 [Senna tora]|uniref:Uncharacterized protein n=1 Tax=Senna tora TaxID=362788 RepID=A0A834WRB1_9FABA|nr:uncharacterized protein G2W53_020205 [Senna tora]
MSKSEDISAASPEFFFKLRLTN